MQIRYVTQDLQAKYQLAILTLRNKENFKVKIKSK